MYIPEDLTLMDRCDSCGAQALVRFTLLKDRRKNLQELLFCGHHGTQNESTLLKKNFVIFEDIRMTAYKEARNTGTDHA